MCCCISWGSPSSKSSKSDHSKWTEVGHDAVMYCVVILSATCFNVSWHIFVIAVNPSANDGTTVDIISALTYDVCRPSVAADNEKRGAGEGRQFEECWISSSGGMTGSRYSSSGGFWVARWIDELRLVELWRLDDESLNDADFGAGSLRSRQMSMSSYISPEFKIPAGDAASVDCDISSYKLLSSSRDVPFCAELLFCADGGSGKARLKNLLVRLSLNSFILSSSVLLSETPTVNKQVRKVLWTWKGVHTTVVTAGHCTYAELTSGHALASCYSCCVHSHGLC